MEKPQEPPWHEFIRELDWLLIDPVFVPAWLALQGIRDTVLATRRVSDGQRRVVDLLRVTTGID